MEFKTKAVYVTPKIMGGRVSPTKSVSSIRPSFCGLLIPSPLAVKSQKPTPRPPVLDAEGSSDPRDDLVRPEDQHYPDHQADKPPPRNFAKKAQGTDSEHGYPGNRGQNFDQILFESLRSAGERRSRKGGRGAQHERQQEGYRSAKDARKLCHQESPNLKPNSSKFFVRTGVNVPPCRFFLILTIISVGRGLFRAPATTAER